MTSQTKTYSLFGEIECAVARDMRERGFAISILPAYLLSAVPPSVARNAYGQPVRMVISMTRHVAREFDRRVEEWRV